MRALEFGSQFQLASEGGHSDPYDESIMNVFGYVLGQQIAQTKEISTEGNRGQGRN